VFAGGLIVSGDDSNPGTKDKPMRSLRRAIELARTGRGHVFACNDTFEGAIMLPSGVDLLGRFREQGSHGAAGQVMAGTRVLGLYRAHCTAAAAPAPTARGPGGHGGGGRGGDSIGIAYLDEDQLVVGEGVTFELGRRGSRGPPPGDAMKRGSGAVGRRQRFCDARVRSRLRPSSIQRLVRT
jgi:hypothetical protein